jgi:prepilin-type N-terminal cleavage/methylation domain-containing protein
MNKTKRAFTLIELLTVAAIVCILAAMVVGGVGGCTRAEGVRTGTVIKFSYKGLIKVTKSWEGTMSLEGLGLVAGKTMANTWDFTVQDPKIAKQVEALVGVLVKVRYDQTAVFNPFTRGTAYSILSIEPIGAKPKLEQ